MPRRLCRDSTNPAEIAFLSSSSSAEAHSASCPIDPKERMALADASRARSTRVDSSFSFFFAGGTALFGSARPGGFALPNYTTTVDTTPDYSRCLPEASSRPIHLPSPRLRTLPSQRPAKPSRRSILTWRRRPRPHKQPQSRAASPSLISRRGRGARSTRRQPCPVGQQAPSDADHLKCPSVERSAMNSPCRSVARSIRRCTGMATKEPGGPACRFRLYP